MTIPTIYKYEVTILVQDLPSCIIENLFILAIDSASKCGTFSSTYCSIAWLFSYFCRKNSIIIFWNTKSVHRYCICASFMCQIISDKTNFVQPSQINQGFRTKKLLKLTNTEFWCWVFRVKIIEATTRLLITMKVNLLALATYVCSLLYDCYSIPWAK